MSVAKDRNALDSNVRRENPDAPQTDAAHYSHRYNSKERMASYWHQVDEVLKFEPRHILEVGSGSGMTTNAIRREGVTVTTLDVAGDLNPSLIASVRAVPLADNAVDVTLCCQVLEHIPFSDFPTALSELLRVSSKGLVISLPDRERYVRFSFVVPRLGGERLIEIPRSKRRRPKNLDPQHCWEIGQGDTGLSEVMAAIENATGCMPVTYRVFQNPYHRFFIIPKS